MTRLKTRKIGWNAVWLLALLLGLSGCAEPLPFVDSVNRPLDVQKKKSTYTAVDVCFTDRHSLEEVTALANEECAKGDKKAVYLGYQSWQCRLTVPHRARFYCLKEGEQVPDRYYSDEHQTPQGLQTLHGLDGD